MALRLYSNPTRTHAAHKCITSSCISVGGLTDQDSYNSITAVQSTASHMHGSLDFGLQFPTTLIIRMVACSGVRGVVYPHFPGRPRLHLKYFQKFPRGQPSRLQSACWSMQSSSTRAPLQHRLAMTKCEGSLNAVPVPRSFANMIL